MNHCRTIKIILSTFCVALIILATGCSTPNVDNVVVESSQKPLAPGLARLSFTRPSSIMGIILTARIKVDGNVVANLDSGETSIIDVKPGLHTLIIEDPYTVGNDTQKIETVPNTEYIFGVVVGGGNSAIAHTLNGTSASTPGGFGTKLLKTRHINSTGTSPKK